MDGLSRMQQGAMLLQIHTIMAFLTHAQLYPVVRSAIMQLISPTAHHVEQQKGTKKLHRLCFLYTLPYVWSYARRKTLKALTAIK